MTKMSNHTLSPSIKSYAFCANLPAKSEFAVFMCTVDPPPNGSFYESMLNQWRVAKCRALVRECEHFMAVPSSPGGRVTVICSKAFAGFGNLHSILGSFGFTVAHHDETLYDQTLKAALEFTLLARLSPTWNKVEPNMLVYGSKFLTCVTGVPAVKYSLFIAGNQARLVIQPVKVKLPILQGCDLEMNTYQSAMDFLTKKVSEISDDSFDLEWVYTLPSMRPARIMSVSHCIPDSSPLKCYADFIKMWFEVYGYVLPELTAGTNHPNSPSGPYVNVKFDAGRYPCGNILYTFPAMCVRPFETIFYRNVDQHLIISVILDHFKDFCPKICGFSLNWLSTQKLNLPKKLNQTAAQKAALKQTSDDQEMEEILAAIRRDQMMSNLLDANPEMPITLQTLQTVTYFDDQGNFPSTSAQQEPLMPVASFQGQNVAPSFITDVIERGQLTVLEPQREELTAHEIASEASPPLVMNAAEPVGEVTPEVTPRQTCTPGTSETQSTTSSNLNISLLTTPPTPSPSPLMVPTSSLFASGLGEVTSSNLRKALTAGKRSLNMQKKPAKNRRISDVANMDHINMSEFVRCRRVESFKIGELKDWLLKNEICYPSKSKKADLVSIVYRSFEEPAPVEVDPLAVVVPELNLPSTKQQV